MNSNRGNNNRRRSRGSNRSQSGSQLNRIDSRARGNAPQLLEKYRKLAQDASLNGDRVQAEYYLQFADHYFRVIADSRAPREDYRPRNDREGEGAEDEADLERGNRRPFEEPDEQQEDGAEEQAPRETSGEFAPVENPFVRDNRQQRSRSRDDRKPRRSRDDDRGGSESHRGQPESESIDAAVLPPAINPTEGADAPEAPGEVEAPKPRRRTRKAKADDGGALENVS